MIDECIGSSAPRGWRQHCPVGTVQLVGLVGLIVPTGETQERSDGGPVSLKLTGVAAANA